MTRSIPMKIKLTAKPFEPTVVELHQLEPGYGYLNLDNHTLWSGVAHVKQEDGRIGTVVVPHTLISDGLTKEESRNFRIWDKSSHAQVLKTAQNRVEKWL